MTPFAKLSAWYRRNKRDLPWRKTRDPYRIFVSEIMLQQTQVDRVIDFYRRWLKTFPTWRSLAEARTDQLLHVWAGLGYNRRALMLREAARTVITQGVPKTIEEWRALKGVGPYTAAAIYAITQQKRAIVIDTNVRRVVGRIWLGIPYPAPTDDQRITQTLELHLPHRKTVWEIPQILMDFGNAVCTPKAPACAICPLRASCQAANKFLTGTAGEKKTVKIRERIHRDKKYPDRIYRGRILAAIRNDDAITERALGPFIDPTFNRERDGGWLRAMLKRLMNDGMIEQYGRRFSVSTR
jgi:A/G-specific adenine glycosylase